MWEKPARLSRRSRGRREAGKWEKPARLSRRSRGRREAGMWEKPARLSRRSRGSCGTAASLRAGNRKDFLNPTTRFSKISAAEISGSLC